MKKIKILIFVLVTACLFVFGITPVKGQTPPPPPCIYSCLPHSECESSLQMPQYSCTAFMTVCCRVVPETPEIHNPVLPNVGVGSGADILAEIIANALKIIYAISGLVLLAMLLWGGIQWMTAGGNKEAAAAAQKRITSALVGFVIFMSVFAIINFIAPVLGLEFLQILKIEWPTP